MAWALHEPFANSTENSSVVAAPVELQARCSCSEFPNNWLHGGQAVAPIPGAAAGVGVGEDDDFVAPNVVGDDVAEDGHGAEADAGIRSGNISGNSAIFSRRVATEARKRAPHPGSCCSR